MIRLALLVAALGLTLGWTRSDADASLGRAPDVVCAQNGDIGLGLDPALLFRVDVPSLSHSSERGSVWKEECRASRIKKTRKSRATRSTNRR